MNDPNLPELLNEALVVGIMSIPPYYVASGLIDKLSEPGSELRSPIFKIFMAGSLFHIIAEYSGFNEWYVENGLASRKRLIGSYQQMAYDRPMMGYYHPSIGRI